MTPSIIVPGGEPFLLPGGPMGCMLLHGFTANPEEQAWLAEDLAARGYTVLGLRLAGHGTDPQDLARTRWHDWLASVEDGLGILRHLTERVVVIGQSLGGSIALLAGSRYQPAAVVAMSAPYRIGLPAASPLTRLRMRLRPIQPKPVPQHPTLGLRREADYPAYAAVPQPVLAEILKLLECLQAELPQVTCPVLLVHSRTDSMVPSDSMQQIFDALGDVEKEMLWLDGFDHSVTRDPQRQLVFDAVARFLRRLPSGPTV